MGHFERKLQTEGKGYRPLTNVGVWKLKWFLFHVISNYPQYIVWFCRKARVCHTDRQTDGQTELRLQDRAVKWSIVAEWKGQVYRQTGIGKFICIFTACISESM